MTSDATETDRIAAPVPGPAPLRRLVQMRERGLS